MTIKNANNPARVLRDDRHTIDEAFRQGARDAALRHKELGLPMAVERNGEIVLVSPDEILAETSVESPSRRKA
jgi:hypothetical protein